MPACLREDGQCIFAALHKLRPLDDGVLADLQGVTTKVANRTYGDVLSRAKVGVFDISLGLAIEIGADCLIHAENGGRPHCIAARRVGGEILLWDGDTERIIQHSDMMAYFMEATDRSSVVTFTLQDALGGTIKTQGPTLGLLQLRAGAGERKRLTVKTRDVEAVGHAPDIMATLASEVDVVKRKLRSQIGLSRADTQRLRIQPVTKCPFCPFRTFQKTSRTLQHLDKHHKESN